MKRLLVVAALLPLAGCPLLEGTKIQNGAMRTTTENFQLTPELAEAAKDLKLSEVSETVEETYDADGRLVSRKTTSVDITRGLPVMTRSADVQLSAEMADDETDVRSSADHAGNAIELRRKVIGRADLQQIVGQTQAQRTEAAADLTLGLFEKAAGVALGKITADRDVDITKSNNETTLGLKRIEQAHNEGGAPGETTPEAPAEAEP